MPFEIIITDRGNQDFIQLLGLMNEFLYERYGDAQKKLDVNNTVDRLLDVVLIYHQGVPVCCGAFKEYDAETIEIKRVFVRKENRGQGLAKLAVAKLEEIARAKGYCYAVLETGAGQPEAIGLYKKLGYTVIPNYGPYIGNENSVCMRKTL